jgi:hypothetical protein
MPDVSKIINWSSSNQMWDVKCEVSALSLMAAEAGARSTDNLGPCTPVFSLNIAGIRAHGRLLRRQTPKPKLPRRRRHVRILALKLLLLLNLIFVFVFA